MPPEEPPPASRIPDLNRFERKLLGATIFGSLGVGSLGLYSSYHAVSIAATNWGFSPNWILPIGLDVSIPVFSLGYLLLIRFDMALAWVRFVPWALTAVTVYLNVVAAGDSRAAQIGHGALPLLWVFCSEIAAHVYRVLIGAATGRRMERVRRSRWVLAPLSTFFLWRRMVLWEVVSYQTGLALERERRMVRASYRQEFGRQWRSKVTRQQLAALKLGELAPVERVERVERARIPLPTQSGPEPAGELEPAPDPVIEPKEPEQGWNDVEPDWIEPDPYWDEQEPDWNETEQEPEAVTGTEQSGTEPPGPEPAGTERNSGTEDLTDRATTKEQQVKEVVGLLERYGTVKVTPKFVKEQVGIPSTTAFRRIKEAKAWLERNGSSGTEAAQGNGRGQELERTGT